MSDEQKPKKKAWKPTAPIKNPKIQIDPKAIEQMSYNHASYAVMAGILGIDQRYLADRIQADPELKAAYKRGEAQAKYDLLQQMITTAFSGDPKQFPTTMLIWLAKNWLGYKDKPEEKAEAPTQIKFVFSKAPDPDEEPTS